MILNIKNIRHGHSLAKEKYDSRFNCWGATLYGLGIINNLEWVLQHDMENFLEEDTMLINENELQRGDILALYNEYGGIEHTALYIGKGVFWHKIGNQKSEFASKNKVIMTYDYCIDIDKTEYRRLMKKNS